MPSKSTSCKNSPEAERAQLYDILVSELTDFVVFLTDIEGCAISWSPGVEIMLGFPEADWLGHCIDRIYTPEDRAAGKLHIELAVAKEKGQWSGVGWHLRRDGSRLFAKQTLVALRDSSGKLLCFSKVMHDLTDRQQREVQLQDALAYTESIVDTIRQPLLVLDSQVRIRSANRAFYRTFGLSKEEAEDQPLFQLRNGQWNLPGLHRLLEELVPHQTTVEDFEIENDFPGLGSKTLLLNARKLWRNGSQTELTLLAIEDITERRQTERMLAETEKQRGLVMDAAPAIISYIDNQLRFRLVNRAYQRWFGVAASSLVGKQVSDLFPASLLAIVQDRIDRALSGESVEFEEVYPSVNGDRTLHVTYTPDCDVTGHVNGFVVLGSDITARKESEIALRKSEERWRSLFDGMAEGFFVGEMIYDANGTAFDFRFVEINPAFEGLTGLSNALGRTMRDLIPAIPDSLIQSYASVVLTGEPAHFEALIPAQNDAWYEVSARRTEPGCFAVLFLNITERKFNEAQLRESEQRQSALVTLGDRLRDLLDISSLTFSAMEITGQTLGAVRAGFGRVVSSQQACIVESNWTDGSVAPLSGKFRFADFGEGLGQSLSCGESVIVSDVSTHAITARDSERWTALDVRSFINLPLVEQGRFVAFLFIHDSSPRLWTESDLSFLRKVADRTWAAVERARALHELQESESFTRSVLASSPDCVKVMNLEGRILTINDGGCKQMEIDDLSAYVLKPWPDVWGERRELADDALRRARAGSTHRFEGFCPTARGTPKWWEVVVTPIRDNSGEPVRLLALSRDITLRKSAEQERERLTLELQRSNEDLSQFAHTVAHDLQSPLRGVMGFAQLLQRNTGERLIEKDLDFLNNIVVSARRMADLVDGLLRFAQVGQGQIARKPVALDSALDAALEALQLQIEEQSATIERASLPMVEGDFVQLVQLFQNLVSNALKYRDPDRAPFIRIGAAFRRGQHLLTVRDNGEGIAPEHRGRIFEPLKRLHGPEVPGTGLGLAMCQRIVSRHGGNIWVESDAGQGSIFLFTLPADESAQLSIP